MSKNLTAVDTKNPDAIKKALAYMEDANNLLNGPWSFLNFIAFKDKYRDAVDLYKKAAVIFKMNDMVEDAIDAYNLALPLSIKINVNYDTKHIYTELAHLSKTTNIQASIEYYKYAINMENNNVNNVAKLWDEIGSSLEKYGDYNSSKQIDQAIIAYTASAKYHEMNGYATSAILKLKNAARLCLVRNRYQDIVDLMDKIISLASLNDTQIYNIKEYIMTTIVCSIFCEDWAKAQCRLHNYIEQNERLNFSESSEIKFLTKLIEYVSINSEKRVFDLINEQIKNYKAESDIAKILTLLQKNYNTTIYEVNEDDDLT